MQWAEGMIFQAFLTEGRILRADEMPDLTRDEYLGGVLDFTGELNRHAVKCATRARHCRGGALPRHCRRAHGHLLRGESSPQANPPLCFSVVCMPYPCEWRQARSVPRGLRNVFVQPMQT